MYYLLHNRVSGPGYNPVGRTALVVLLLIEIIDDIPELKHRFSKILKSEILQEYYIEIRDMLEINEYDYEPINHTRNAIKYDETVFSFTTSSHISTYFHSKNYFSPYKSIGQELIEIQEKLKSGPPSDAPKLLTNPWNQIEPHHEKLL